MSVHTERKRTEILAELTAEAQATSVPLGVLMAVEIIRLLRGQLGVQIGKTGQGQGGGRPYRSRDDDF